MTLSDDGTESFSFTIPMHLWVQDGDVTVKKENPIWYTVRDGVLMVNMRKIKVIFNKTFGSAEQKQAAGERVFEFLITKITESHEEDNPTCQVECEGLAFHELGKQGYKIELSSDVFYDRDNTYYNGDTDGSMIWYDNLHQPHADCPRATVDYWMNDLGIKHARYEYKYTTVATEFDDKKEPSKTLECLNGLDTTKLRKNLNPTEWYYDVQMDWSAYSDVDKYNIETSIRAKRETDKVYEEPYVSSWDKNLNPKLIEPAREKERLIDANESNLYNLTQTIAENFEIFCRYEYSYDSRYQITGRKIIFYNTFHADYNSNYFEHLNYPHSTSSVSREYDGTEITTKMYVRPETDDSSVTGQISIIDSSANPTKEDYVMNFDYLHDIGTISDEQYGEIKNYNLKMKYYNEGEIVGTGFDTTGAIALQDSYYRKNDRIYIKKNDQWEVAGLITLQEQLLAKQDRKIEVDAKLTVANNSASEAQERLDDACSHIGSGSNQEKNIQSKTVDDPAPEPIVKYKDPNGKEYYQLSLSDSGIFPDSIKMYKKWIEKDKSFSAYTSEITDIPDSDLKELFDNDNLNFRKWDEEGSAGNKALIHYMKAAGLKPNNADDVDTAKRTLNRWYTKLKNPWDSFDENEIPAFVKAKVTQKDRPKVYATKDDCTLATDAIGWVLHILGKASYKKLDANNWKKYVLQVKSPAGKEYFLKSLASQKEDEKYYIDKITWNEWVACRLEWCLAAQKGILTKDIQMTKGSSGNSYTATSKLSWSKLAPGDSLTVTVKDHGEVEWAAKLATFQWSTEKTASTLKKLCKYLSAGKDYYDLLEQVGIYHYPNQITSFEVVKDNEGNPTGIRRIPIESKETLTKVYLTYDFDPITYYRNIRLMWEKKLLAVRTDQKLLSDEQFQLETSITNLKEVIRAMLKDKFTDTRKFDHLMGPAMRESYWQPEDYHDYGDYYSQRLNAIFFNNKNTELPTWRDEQVSAGFFWDSELFPEEEKGYYYLGVDTNNKHFYPCIDLFSFFKSHDESPATTIIIDGTQVDLDNTVEAVTDEMVPIINSTTEDEMVSTGMHQYASIDQTNTPYNIVGSGVLTATATGNSYIAGIRKMVFDESQGAKIPSIATGAPEEGNISIATTQPSPSGQNVPITVSDNEIITGISLTENSNNNTTFDYINTFVQNFDKLAFSYYNDGFDKQVQTSEAYNVATQNYQINPISNLNNAKIEYRYDQSLFAAVKEKENKHYVQWYYKTKFIETTTTVENDENETEHNVNHFTYQDVEVNRSDADRVFYSIGSRTANGAFVENDEVKLMFLRKTKNGTSTIIPVLMFKGLDSAPDSLLHYIQQPINYDETEFINNHKNNLNKLYRIHPGAQPAIGFYNYDGTTKFEKIGYVQPKHWINFSEEGCTYEVVYPRIKINSLQLKPSSVSLSLNYDLLTQYEDYYIFTRKTDHLITIKPHIFFEMHGSTTAAQKKIVESGKEVSDYFITKLDKKQYYLASKVSNDATEINGYIMGINSNVGEWLGEKALEIENLALSTITSTNYIDEMNVVGDLGFFASVQDKIARPLRITYAISNGGTRTYLDALKVIKENSQPKVAYNVTPNIANSKLVSTLYNRLGQIVGINDTELKFKNVFGYISSIELDLDHPWEDSVEVKNYTNKFEDLFSSITAQTEAMKKSSGMMAGFASGNFPMALDQSIVNTVTETINAPANLSNLMEAFDGPGVVQEALYSIFDEANTILDSGREGINELLNLNSQNAQIFSTFIKNIRAQTTPTVFTGDPTQITGFKAGDICYGEDGRTYIAASGDAFMPVYDGNVSKIVGASVEWDANLGTVNIEGATQIDIKSGSNIDIAADSNINIIGNKSVNIGGATINIGSAIFETTDANGNTIEDTIAGGINIVSSYIGEDDEEDSSTEQEPESGTINTKNQMSGVFIHPEQISLLSSNIVMEGAEKIQMYTSNGSRKGTSAFQISTTEGIWMGSGKGIEIYADATHFSYDAENQELSRDEKTAAVINQETGEVITPATYYGASVSIQPERILMGVATQDNGTVVKITDKQMVIGSAEFTHAENDEETVVAPSATNMLTGAVFAADKIAFATETNKTEGNVTSIYRNLISMDGENGIILGHAKKVADEAYAAYVVVEGETVTGTTTDITDKNIIDGSYVKISADGIKLGSMADMYINTNNLKLQTRANISDGSNVIFAIGTDLQSTGAIGDQGVGLAFVDKTLTVKGTIKADSLILSSNAKATMEEIIAGKVTGTYIGSKGFYTKTEIDGKNYTTLAAVGNRIWAELKGEGADGSISHTGWSITTSGMSIISTGAFTVSAGNFQLDGQGNTKFIASANNSTVSQSYYITNTNDSNRIGYILAKTAIATKFEDSSGDFDGGANTAKAISPPGTDTAVQGIGLFAKDDYGVFSYPSYNGDYPGGIVVKENADIIGGLRVGSYGAVNPILRGSLITRTYIKTNKIFIDTDDGHVFDKYSGQPRISFSFTKKDPSIGSGHTYNGYGQYQTKFYLSMGDGDEGRMRLVTRVRMRSASSDWAAWPEDGGWVDGELSVGRLNTSQLKVGDGNLITKVVIDNTAATGTTERYIHFYTGSYIYTVKAIRTSNT